jgi:hypothetical protein
VGETDATLLKADFKDRASDDRQGNHNPEESGASLNRDPYLTYYSVE